MAEELVALPTGSALGFGNGPLLLARAGPDPLPPPTVTPQLSPTHSFTPTVPL